MVIYIPDISENNDPYYSLSCISFADFKSNYNFDQFLFSDHFLIVHRHFLLKSIIALLCEVCLYPGWDIGRCRKSTCANGQINIVAPAGHTQLHVVDFAQSEPRIKFLCYNK